MNMREVRRLRRIRRRAEFVVPLESTRDSAESDQSCKTSAQTIAIDFAELSDGTLLELVVDAADENRTLLAVWKNDQHRKVEYVSEFTHGNITYIPRQCDTQALKSILLPTEALPYSSAKTICEDLEKLITQCIDLPAKYIPVLADFILSTWFVDRFRIAPYLSVVGLPQSGKTTVLKLLALLCRRPLFIGDATEATLYRATSELMPTILIDEAATIKNSPALRHMLRIGTTHDAVSMRGSQIFHPYGAKVISWIEPPDDMALNSRCIQVPMSETSKSNLRPIDDPGVKESANRLRAQMLQYRLENYKAVHMAQVSGDENLRPRSRDLLQALMAPTHRRPDRTRPLLALLISGDVVPQESLTVEQNAVIRAIFSVVHTRKVFDAIETGQLTEIVNYFLKKAGEPLRLKPRKTGAVLTSLGFCNRTRTNTGWVVRMTRGDAEKIHELADRYGIFNMSDRLLMVGREDCPLCRSIMEKNSKLTPAGPVSSSESINITEALRGR